MTFKGLWKKLGCRLIWVREHRRIKRITQRALKRSEAYRHELIRVLGEARMELRHQRVDTVADASTAPAERTVR